MPRKASLANIQAQIRKLQRKAERLQKAEKPGVSQLRTLVKTYKLTVRDFKKATGETKAGMPSKLKGRKVPPKYRNPSSKSETWSGRGMKPRWLVAQLGKGKKLADFEI